MNGLKFSKFLDGWISGHLSIFSWWNKLITYNFCDFSLVREKSMIFGLGISGQLIFEIFGGLDK